MRDLNCEFTAIDVTSKPEIMKAFKEDQVVPYVYLSGIPCCGLEGVDQLPSQPEFKKQIRPKKLTVNERIEKLLGESNIILFMKGVPESPECGFSSRIVNILKEYDSLKYDHFNIFEDNEIREGLKKYSNWPTYPQLYVMGKLIGGIDIVQEMHEENELEDVLMAA